MFKKILLYVLIISSLFLTACGSNKTKNKDITIKIGDYQLNIPNTYFISSIDKNIYKDVDILYVYKDKKQTKKVHPSLVIGKYNGSFPSDIEYFKSILLDKIHKNIAGSSILDNGDLDDVDGYYIKYKVDDNLFGGEEQNIYYGLQTYLLDKQKKSIYIISYISIEEDDINNIFDSIKDLKLNR